MMLKRPWRTVVTPRRMMASSMTLDFSQRQVPMRDDHNSMDPANYLGSMWRDPGCQLHSCRIPKIPRAGLPDARSTFLDAMPRISTSFAERRVEIDISALRQNCQTLKWVPSEESDNATKRSSQLRDETTIHLAEEGQGRSRWRWKWKLEDATVNRRIDQC